MELTVYEVVVRNELTGEVVTMNMGGFVPQDAQTRALIELFRTRGWRKCSAAPPLATDLRAPGLDVDSARSA